MVLFVQQRFKAQEGHDLFIWANYFGVNFTGYLLSLVEYKQDKTG